MFILNVYKCIYQNSNSQVHYLDGVLSIRTKSIHNHQTIYWVYTLVYVWLVFANKKQN